MAYHYTESGLDNVFLLNGYEIHKTPYGEGVSIQNSEALHRAIGRWLVELPAPLRGAELRFLRLEMELSQKQLAALIGSTEQNVRRWEKAQQKPVPGPADRLLRALYSEATGSGGSVSRIASRLAESGQMERAEAHLSETAAGWQIAA
jgi:putative transcriptional regulator